MSGQTIGGRYELAQPLGGGGAMGSVWLAHDRKLERDVAVKLLAKDADRARFDREAHAVAGLSHPNICQLYDYGQSEHNPYMVLEYLPGGTLEERLAGGRALPDEQTLRIANDVASGLAHAHERGLVHRDLKPANILFDGEGRAKIADFGIARIAGGRALTAAGTVLGTAAYLPPEQAEGERATPASDVYSFGVILFRMLTGRTPFVSKSAAELVRMHREDEPPAVEAVRADAQTLLASLALTSLAKAASERPADGAALVAALHGSVASTALLAPAAAAPLRDGIPSSDASATRVVPRRPRGRQRALLPLVLAAALLALVGAGAAFVVTGSSGESPVKTSVGSLDLPAVGREPAASSTTPAAQAPAQATTTASAASAPTTASTATTRPTTTTAPPATATPAATTQPATVPATTTDVTASTTTTPATSSTTDTTATTPADAATTGP